MQGPIIQYSDGTWLTTTHAGTVVLHKGYIPRLQVVQLQQEENSFEVQQINTGNILLYFSQGYSVKRVKAVVTMPEACLAIFVVLSGTLSHSMQRIPGSVLYSGQYTVFYAHEQDIHICIEASKHAVILAIFIPATIGGAQLTMYPGLSLFATNIKQQTACYLTDEALYMHAGIYDLVTRILVAPYHKKLHPLYETLCIALLNEMLSSSLQSKGWRPPVQTVWMQSIYNIKAFIDQRIDLHYTIDQLATKGGINTRQLKAGFKALFGSGVYTYLKRQRMKAAYAALEQTTASIKYISGKCGYRNVHSFSRAFKFYFGENPGDVQRKK